MRYLVYITQFNHILMTVNNPIQAEFEDTLFSSPIIKFAIVNLADQDAILPKYL